MLKSLADLVRMTHHDPLAVPLEYAAGRESGGRECPLTADGGGSADP